MVNSLSNQNKKIKHRQIIQGIFAALWLVLIFIIIPRFIQTMHQHCPFAIICFGSMNLAGLNVYLPITIISFLILIITIFIGRKFCSYICFLGILQEYLSKLNKKSVQLPDKWHRLFARLKYLILFTTILLSFLSLQYYYMQFCPLENLAFPKMLTASGGIFLFLIFLLSYFVPRFWCRYLCPYAALMNIFLYLGKLLRIKRPTIVRNPDKCINCKLCEKNCLMGISITKFTKIEDVNCIYCYRCIEESPKKVNCLEYR